MSGKSLVDELKKNGWRIDRIKGSHYVMKKGDKTVIIPVHGNKDLPKGLELTIRKQAGL